MLELKKKHHKHRYKVKHRKVSTESKSFDYEIFLCSRVKWHFSSEQWRDNYILLHWDVHLWNIFVYQEFDKQEQEQWSQRMQYRDQRPEITQDHLESLKAINLH